MNAVTELRLRLRHAGYEPVPLIGKAPRFDNWQKIAQDSTDFTIMNWETTLPAFENTGGLTRLMPSIDIDILQQDAAEAIEQLVYDRFEDRGYVLPRIGRAPKRAVPLRTDTPFGKITANLVARPAMPVRKLSFLGAGSNWRCLAGTRTRAAITDGRTESRATRSSWRICHTAMKPPQELSWRRRSRSPSSSATRCRHRLGRQGRKARAGQS
jgi:hypothetical protein